MDNQHQRDFLEIENAVKTRISFLGGLNFTEEEIKVRKEELSIVLKKIEKVRQNRLSPLKSIKTVHETKFKLGDYFHIPGDELSVYKIVLFPDAVTIRGEAKNPAIGKPYTCEVYCEVACKVKQKEKATKRIKKDKKPKKIKIKEGDYFALVSHNAIYKAIEVSKKKVVGTNKLQGKRASKMVKFDPRKTKVVIKSKKDYKKQHKAT